MEYVDRARAVSALGELVLRERLVAPGEQPVLELRANGLYVMDTGETTTERALAAAALAGHDRPARVLMGGLGLGFTLAEVLSDPRVERCTVVEIEATLVDWLRDGTVPHGPALLADPRAEVLVADVAEHVRGARDASYDLVLLDVDNGPGNLVHDGNAGLYRQPFLADVRRVLATGGALVIWSAAESPPLEQAMREAFGHAEAHSYDVRLGERDECYWLYGTTAR